MQKSVEKIFGWLYKFLKKREVNDFFASYFSAIVNLILLSILAYLTFLIFRYVFEKIMVFVAKKTKTKFDDLLVSKQTTKYIAHLIPLLVVYKAVPIILKHFIYWENIFGKLIEIYIVLLILWISSTILTSFKIHLKQIPNYSDKPIDSYIQVIMIVLWSFGIITIILLLFNTSIKTLMTTFGAISAIVILIFRDTILGLVASIQVSVNDMVRIGDWITMEKFGADGDVIEINLATVKVRNFDNTTTTIPTYSLISDSFKNWRGMLGSNGRRIKRHIFVKATSIRFLEKNELEDLKKIRLVNLYITQRQTEIDRFNESHNIDKSLLVNGRNMTNFGLFRKYITKYLEEYPGLNKDMILLCRQLQPTPHGIPLEIYTFSSDKRFVNYEYIMADIFDHIFASISYFKLEIFEMKSPDYQE
ncbi:MAG: mechanosensitive ion channel family protein [Flavobacterium sp.]